jgi:hypothetical protein
MNAEHAIKRWRERVYRGQASTASTSTTRHGYRSSAPSFVSNLSGPARGLDLAVTELPPVLRVAATR